MATWHCPDCGHDQFHVDGHGVGEDRQAIDHLTCTQCGQQVQVKPSPAYLTPGYE
jgi:transcription elongation factor Elf1